MRPAPEPSVLSWVARQSPEHLHVTAITMAEILFGSNCFLPANFPEALRAGAERFFGVVFADRTLAFDDRAARTFSLIASSRRKQGRPISEFDAQIAAIARAHGAALATRNTHDFEGCAVRLINPWQG
jgi:toxin FitB